MKVTYLPRLNQETMSRSVSVRSRCVAYIIWSYAVIARAQQCTQGLHGGYPTLAQDLLVSYMPLAIISGAKFFELKGLVRTLWAVRTGGTPS